MKYLRKGTEREAHSMLDNFYDNDVVILSASEDGSADKTYINFCEADLDNPTVEFEWWFDTCRYWDDDYNEYPCVKIKFTKIDLNRLKDNDKIVLCLEYTKLTLTSLAIDKKTKNKTYSVFTNTDNHDNWLSESETGDFDNTIKNYIFLNEVSVDEEYNLFIRTKHTQYIRPFWGNRRPDDWEFRCKVRPAFRYQNSDFVKQIKPEKYKYFSGEYNSLITD